MSNSSSSSSATYRPTHFTLADSAVAWAANHPYRPSSSTTSSRSGVSSSSPPSYVTIQPIQQHRSAAGASIASSSVASSTLSSGNYRTAPSEILTQASNTLTSHSTIYTDLSRNPELRDPRAAAAAPLMPPRPPGQIVAMGRAEPSSTLQHLRNILDNLDRLPSTAERALSEETFNAMMVANLVALGELEGKEGGHSYHHGSEWALNGLNPLDASTLIVMTYPPKQWPNWVDASPTMKRMAEAGIWPIVNSGKVQFMHIHNHMHLSETRAHERDEVLDVVRGRWPGDSPALVEEIEGQATDIICARMSRKTSLVLVLMGHYAASWFEACHNNGRFALSLGYQYVLRTVSFPLTDPPQRFFEIKIIVPKDKSTPTIAVMILNSGAFPVHEIDNTNDCLGKAMRVDAGLEILRSCYGVHASMPTKSHFANVVWEGLRQKGLRGSRPRPRNLMLQDSSTT